MLYLDSSALMKRYVIEKGSGALSARFERGENIYTSLLSFGEIHAALARIPDGEVDGRGFDPQPRSIFERLVIRNEPYRS